MSTQLSVILALTPIAEREFEPLLFDSIGSPLTILSSTVEGDELQRAVELEKPDAVLLSPDLSGLSTSTCERVRAKGVQLVGLALDERQQESLRALGVETTIGVSASRDDLLSAIRAESNAIAAEPAPTPAEHPTRREGSGSILAVVGGKGAPGASEFAASLAALAARQWATLLVEADALGGGLDVRLGANATGGSLVGLMRAATSGGVQRELVERWIVEPEGWPSVLLGPPDASALAELAWPGATTDALHELAALYALTICDVGAFLGEDGQPSPAARLHREALLAADSVLLVLGTRDTQLRSGLRQLDLLLGTLGIASERLRIIANGVNAPGTASRSQITETTTTHLAERGVGVDAWLPWDARAIKQAQKRGLPLASARGRGGYARAVSALLGDLFLSAAEPTPKRRKRRITMPRQQQRDEEVSWQR
jgi:MinD-like ATPase involved in chromosome partitioning or flagellar assembly